MQSFEADPEGHHVVTTFRSPRSRTSQGHVYLVTHTSLGAGKIGQSRSGPRDWRVQEHISYGWEEYNRFQYDDESLAGAVETYVLRSLRARGIKAFLTPSQMPQGGASETFALEEISASEVWELVQEANRVVRLRVVVVGH